MAYTLEMTERLQGLCISRQKGPLDNSCVISKVLDELMLTHGIKPGDRLLELNGEWFPDVVSKSEFDDPTCILWDIELPFTLTLFRSASIPSSSSKSDDAVPSPF